MPESYDCPADGCDYTGMSKIAVRSHTNSLDDPTHPPWGEIKPELESDDVDTDTDESVSNDKQKSAGNDTESSDNQENDTDNESETMPTTDEYQQQYQDDTDSDTDSDTDNSNSNSLSMPSLPVNPTTLLVLFVIAISLYLMYRTVGSSSAGANGIDSDEIATEDTTPDDTSFEADGDDLEPGLIGG